MKLQLDIDSMTDDFFSDTRLLGIMAPIKDYSFCWQLNSLLGYNFRLNTDVEIQIRKKTRSYYFSVYQYIEPHSNLTHFLYVNQNDGEYLLPDFKHMDFLWLMKYDLVDDTKVLGITSSIKSINRVQLVAELTNEKIRSRERLIF
ncbi:IPExxxVDY family protein [Segetibacter sp. 3557_3]|uniref:IPExxxVDY family protein n=1 Tax=Segetibacter sp. 3557_3 TaxID=2547429 RepID=UPI0010585C43|nr:IPExxxVDY family protein [Segetibacter sp. 3557_3]TDH19717.1 IPExxxVDY family protein [Segetibacter sp. 3557_3]